MQTIEAPSFETFYTTYWQLVRQIISQMLHDACRESIDDLIQETFLKAWRAYGRLDYGPRVRSWISMIARNVARDYLRHVRVSQRWSCSFEEEITREIPDTSAGRWIPLLSSEEAEVLTQAFQQLVPRDRLVIALLFKGCTHQEIKGVLQMKEDTYRKAVKRARSHFRQAYQSLCG